MTINRPRPRPVAALAAVGLLALLASPWAAAAAEDPAALPRLVMPEKIFHAGVIPAGDTVTHDFILRNDGQSNLEIIQVVPGCGCTAADFDRLIPPGGQGRVSLKVEFYAEWAGRRLKQATLLETNDPEAKYVTLTVSAEVGSPAAGGAQ